MGAGRSEPRLNPFALPSETTMRFVLLVVMVVGTSLFVFNWLYFSVTDRGEERQIHLRCLATFQTTLGTTGDPGRATAAMQDCEAQLNHRKARFIVAGTAGVLLLAAGLYAAVPAVKRRRRRLQPLEADVPEVARAVAELSAEAGLRRPPSALWNPLQAGSGALAFGVPWRPCIALGGGLVAAYFTDRPAFDAVVRHELAHLRNWDVGMTYGALAVWWAFLIAGVVPLLASFVDSDLPSVGGLLWRLVVLAAVVYLTRNAILRAREFYADVRASVWDGADGALRRVLAAVAPPRRPHPLKRLVSMHPEPEERRRMIDAPAALFRLSPWDALAAGIAAGIAYPNVVNVLSLALTGSGSENDAHILAALICAPPVAAMLVVAAWRATQARLAGGAGVVPMLPAAALAVGLAAGQELSFDAIVSVQGGVSDVSRAAITTLWVVALLAVVLVFTQWLAAASQAWLPVARRSPRPLLWLCTVVASLVLAFALGEFHYLSTSIELIRSSPDAVALQAADFSRDVIDLVTTQTVTFLLLAALWAFPLGGWLVRRRGEGAAEWAWLDGPRTVVARRAARTRIDIADAVVIAALAAVASVVLVFSWRAVVHATVPADERGTDAYVIAFVYRSELVAVIVQAAVAVLIALRARRAGLCLALFGAFLVGVVFALAFLAGFRVAGCVDALTIRSGPGECPSPLEASFAWTIVKDWVNEGALLSLVTVPVALGLRSLLEGLPPMRPAAPDEAVSQMK